MTLSNRTNEPEESPATDERDVEPSAADKPAAGARPPRADTATRPRSARRLGLGVLLLIAVAVAYGAWQHLAQGRQVMAITEQQKEFVPTVRVATVRGADSEMVIALPGTTLAFAAANIFARANGYIETRKVDIGDHVKAGDLLALITAPELDHQIAQAQAMLSQNQATLQQAQASRDLAQVTHDRDSTLVQKGWLTPQQGDTDRLTLEAQRGAVALAQANIAAQQSQIRVLQ